MALKDKDFVEIEFTGKVKDGEIFDSNIKKDLEEMHKGHDHPIHAKPFVFCLGEDMFLKGVDEFLIGKPEVTKDYTIELEPEKAFGKRDPSLIQMTPISVFKEHNMNPVQGTMFNFDGKIGKVLTVSGGRVIIDFNNPLAGKNVVYQIKVMRKINDLNEKINALNEFFFRKELKFKVDGKKLTIEIEKPMKNFAEFFKDKFKEILGLDLEVKEIEEKSKESQNKSQ